MKLGPVPRKLNTVLLANAVVSNAPVLNSLRKPSPEPRFQLFSGPVSDSGPAQLRAASSVAAH